MRTGGCGGLHRQAPPTWKPSLPGLPLARLLSAAARPSLHPAPSTSNPSEVQPHGQVLDIQGCSNLTHLPSLCEPLAHLRHLDCSGYQQLLMLPADISRLTDLLSLRLAGCTALMEVPEAVWRLTRLTHLDLKGCRQLQRLPSGIQALAACLEVHAYAQCMPENGATHTADGGPIRHAWFNAAAV